MAMPQPMRGPVAGLWHTCLIRLFGGLALLGVSFLTEAANYTLAVVPQASPSETYRRWAPFVEQLQRVTGQHLQLRVYRSFDEFETDLVNGLADFAYMNPYHFLMAHRVQGYLPLVRDGSRQLSGQLLVRRDSPLKSVKELNGKTIAFPDPNAFAASLYMRALLREKANIRFTASYLGTHANVYRHVILGSVAAGTGVNVTLARERPETRDELRVLYETPGTAPHPLCAHPRTGQQRCPVAPPARITATIRIAGTALRIAATMATRTAATTATPSTGPTTATGAAGTTHRVPCACR